ncbi:MAG: protein kinase [Proteobacteria bacterium]|nr:protein kinase [Pseudomonadota bacterium]
MERSRQIGRRIGRYELLEEIGHGGMAVVYRARDTNLQREVALKLLHPHLASHLESRQRFQREARAVARLKHPAVLEIYDYADVEREDIFIVMELVQGSTLRRFLDNRTGEPLSAEAVALLFRQVAAALAHAHANGVVHRDVKPENILIGPKGKIKLSDFGIAHLAGLSQMTVTGQILGSPAYMSPEHIEQAELDARADVFSAGTVLYEMAVGAVPFEGKNPHATIKKIVEGDYSDPLRSNPAVGYNLGSVIRRCLALDPKERYETARELVSELDAILDTMGIGPVEEELTAFFAGPEAWTEKRKPEVIAKTLSLGLAARRQQNFAEAMDHFNRVLAREPGNERALSAVAGMTRRRRVRRILERSIFVAPVLIVLIAVAWASVPGSKGIKETSTPPGNPGTIVIRPDASPSVADRGPAVIDAGEKKVGPVALPKNERATSKRQISKAQKTRVVVFTPNPMAVEIDIDGKERFPFGPANRKRILSVGKHTISFVPNNSIRFIKQTWKIRIPPGDIPFHFRERLRWRPAKLLVESNAEAVVTIPGRATGKANKPFEVSINKGPEEQVSLLVSAEGYILRTKQVTITAGELARIRVTLIKTRKQTSSL